MINEKYYYIFATSIVFILQFFLSNNLFIEVFNQSNPTFIRVSSGLLILITTILVCYLIHYAVEIVKGLKELAILAKEEQQLKKEIERLTKKINERQNRIDQMEKVAKYIKEEDNV